MVTVGESKACSIFSAWKGQPCGAVCWGLSTKQLDTGNLALGSWGPETRKKEERKLFRPNPIFPARCLLLILRVLTGFDDTLDPAVLTHNVPQGPEALVSPGSWLEMQRHGPNARPI